MSDCELLFRRLPSSEGLELLIGPLGFDVDLDRALLSSIGKVASALFEYDHDEVSEELREFLNLDDRTLREQANLALGRIRDPQAVPRLVELLSDEEAGLAASAHWALREMTGLSFPLRQDQSQNKTFETSFGPDSTFRHFVNGEKEALTSLSSACGS